MQHSLRLFVLTLLLTQVQAAQPAAAAKREPIGSVLGKTVYRDQITAEGGNDVADEVRRLFIGPVMEKYLADHKAEVEPTAGERAAAERYYAEKHAAEMKEKEPKLRARLKEIETLLAAKGKARPSSPDETGEPSLEDEKSGIEADLEPPDPRMAEMVVVPWKLQRHLYDKFGGGRVLWQQFGMEAYDAMRKWLETQETGGGFKITDPALRTALFEYWTSTQGHEQFLVSDPKRIREEFLDPEWLRRGK